jgi:glycosyltransferase involved in cell wall biosynthesis/thymidylate kinase
LRSVNTEVRTDLEDSPTDSDATIALLRTILSALDASGCRYAVIHAGRGHGLSVSTDVDVAFDGNPNEILVPIIQRLSKSCSARLVQCLHYEIPHGYYYIFCVPGDPPGFLHLDCLYDPLGVNRYRLPTPWLLEGAVAGLWGKQTRHEKMALYLLTKRAIKGDASPEALNVLRSCFDGASDALWAEVRDWFGDGARALIEQLFQAECRERVAITLAQLRASGDRRFRRKHPLRYFLSFGIDAIRKVRRLVRPTGLFVAVVGPDGAGKSTIAGLAMSRLARAFRKTWRFHWRPGLLPKLRRRARVDERREVSETPPATSKYRGALSLARFLYYWLDFVAGYWLIIYPRKARTTLVIGERYFPDVLVHPQRYGFALPRWLMRLAAVCVPSPDLLVLLQDTPEAIYARKPELSPAVLAEQLAAYEEEIQHWGKSATITTERGPEAVADRLSELILDYCANRTARRLERYNVQGGWRGFPSARRVKVWVDGGDKLPSALNIYHPYSSSGRFAKWLVHSLPVSLHHGLLWGRPDSHIADRLDHLARTIREVLGNEEIAVSFSAGTAGPHRKLTGQASHGGNVFSYIKTGNTSTHTRLLQQEAAMLTWLHSVEFSGAVVPKVLAVKSCEQHQLLFLSAPAQPGTRRSLRPDDKDARFLSALAANDHHHIAAQELLAANDFTTFLAAAERSDSSLAATLQLAKEVICNVFGETGIRLTPCHGDYAPWNTLELHDGSLYVFDWEYSSKDSPLLTDLFHRVLMPARLVLREPASRVMARLLKLHADPIMGPVIARSGVAPAEVPGYLLLYLIRVAMRESATGGPFGDFLSEAFRHVLGTFSYPIRRRNVLVAAYACEPGHGSEPGVGWNMCQAISREHNAWVITRKNNREPIERALAQHPNAHLQFRYADLPYWARFWKRGRRGIRTYYYLWQFAAWLEAHRLKRSVHFDVAHHVTFVNSYLFSFLALLNLPFVWGPIGNNPKAPASLQSSAKALLRDRLRYGFQQLMRAVDPFYWICASRARLIIGINPTVGDQFPLTVLGKTKFVSHTAIGVEEDLLAARIGRHHESGIRVLTMGQLTPIKGFHLAIRAFVRLLRSEPHARLIIVGDGPEKARLEELAAGLSVAENVDFVAWLPRDEAMSKMSDADIFLFPSFEGSGMVVLEAMAHGLPVICLDFGGPGDAVSKDCGFAVEVGTLDESVDRLGAALTTLAGDTSMRLRMGLAARQRVAQGYLWQDRHQVISQWYAIALSETSTNEMEGPMTANVDSGRDPHGSSRRWLDAGQTDK